MNALSLLLSLFVAGGAAQLSPSFYQSAVQAYHQKQFTKATKALRKILVSLEDLEKKEQAGTKKRYFLVLGQCDMLYYLAQIAKQRGQQRLACRRLQRMSQRLRTVPKRWTSWAVQPHLRVHMRDGQRSFAKTCPSVPSVLRVSTSPQDAQITYRSTLQERWKPLSGTTLTTLQTRLLLRAQRKGYETKTTLVRIPRWRVTTFSLTLKRQEKPKVTIVPPPAPPKATPFYKTWWFWTATGVVVAGGVAAAIAVPLTDKAQIQVKAKAW